MIIMIRYARLQINFSTWSDRCATGYFTKLVVMTPLLHDYTVYDKFMTVSCHSYDGDMSLLKIPSNEVSPNLFIVETFVNSDQSDRFSAALRCASCFLKFFHQIC